MKVKKWIFSVTIVSLISACNGGSGFGEKNTSEKRIEQPINKNTLSSKEKVEFDFFSECSLDSIGALKFGKSDKEVVSNLFFARPLSSDSIIWFNEDSLWRISRKWVAYFPFFRVLNSNDHIHNNVFFAELVFETKEASNNFNGWVKEQSLDSKSHFCVFEKRQGVYLIFRQAGFKQYKKFYTNLDSCITLRADINLISDL